MSAPFRADIFFAAFYRKQNHLLPYMITIKKQVRKMASFVPLLKFSPVVTKEPTTRFCQVYSLVYRHY